MVTNDLSGKVKRKNTSPIKLLNKSPNSYNSNKSASRKAQKMINHKMGKSPSKGQDETFNIGLYGDDNNYLTKVNCE